MIKLRKLQKGMNLVEVMIALVLASLIVLAIVNLFMTNYRNYRIDEGLSRIQENSRFAFDIFNENIRQAGYSGCRAVKDLKIQVIADPPVSSGFWQADQIIQGYDGGANSIPAGLPASVATTILPGTDAIRIRTAADCGASLTGNLTAANANIKVVANSCDFKQGDIVMVSDCEDAHIFRITNNPQGGTLVHAGGNQSNHLCTMYNSPITPGACMAGSDKLYGADATVMKLRSALYYLRDNPANVPSLYEVGLEVGAVAVELVEGVEDMEMAYGADITVPGDKIIDTYFAQPFVADWGQILSVRISLMMNSIEDNLVDEKLAPTTIENVYTQSGIHLTPAAVDKQLRRTFTTTIGIRNTLP